MEIHASQESLPFISLLEDEGAGSIKGARQATPAPCIMYWRGEASTGVGSTYRSRPQHWGSRRGKAMSFCAEI